MDDSKSTEEQLMLLKGQTVRLNVIHEAQRLQMELWPRMSKQIDKCTPKANFEEKLIVLDCKAKKYKHGSFEKELFDNILIWVRRILWDETKVVIKVNGKRMFDSSNQ